MTPNPYESPGAVEEPIKFCDAYGIIDAMSDEEYVEFVEAALNCKSVHTLPAIGVPTR